MPLVPAQADPIARDDFTRAIDQYSQARTAAGATYRMLADRAWQDFCRAMRAAETEYVQQVQAAGLAYDNTVSGLVR